MINKINLLLKYTLQQLELHSKVPLYLYTDESCIPINLIVYRIQIDKFSLIENDLSFIPQSGWKDI